MVAVFNVKAELEGDVGGDAEMQCAGIDERLDHERFVGASVLKIEIRVDEAHH
jgi:hypothetical protein